MVSVTLATWHPKESRLSWQQLYNDTTPSPYSVEERKGEREREREKYQGEAMRYELRYTEAILQHTSTLDQSAIVVDALLHSLVLTTVVDNEQFVAATAAMTHCWGRAHASEMTVKKRQTDRQTFTTLAFIKS